jgi:hypothetical protein
MSSRTRRARYAEQRKIIRFGSAGRKHDRPPRYVQNPSDALARRI